MRRGAVRWAVGRRLAAVAAGTVAFAVAVTAAAATAAVAAAAAPLPPDLLPERHAVESGRLRSASVQLDNDSLATWPHDDRWYTSGLVAHWVREAGDDGGARWIADAWCVRAGCGDGLRLLRLVTLAHAIWTPADTRRTRPEPGDRPYGAWLSLGLGVLLREPGEATRLDLRLGLVGPGALGESAQRRSSSRPISRLKNG